MKRTGLSEDPRFAAQMDRSKWPAMKVALEAVFKTKTREAWTQLLEGTDACFAPVLTPAEAPDHPHNVARKTFAEVAGVVQPAPAPRFSRTPGEIQRPPAVAGAHTDEALRDWGFSESELSTLREQKAIA